MTEYMTFEEIMQLNDEEIKRRRALSDPERIDRLANHLYLTFAKRYSPNPLPFEQSHPDQQQSWRFVAEAAVTSITGGMWGEKPMVDKPTAYQTPEQQLADIRLRYEGYNDSIEDHDHVYWDIMRLIHLVEIAELKRQWAYEQLDEWKDACEKAVALLKEIKG